MNSPPSCLAPSDDTQPMLAVCTTRNSCHQIWYYLTWCSNRGLSATRSLPASEELYSAYAASLSRDVENSTAASYLSAVDDWHVRNGFIHRNGKDLHSRRLLKYLPPAAERILVKEEHIILLHNGLDLSGRNGLHSCVAAAAKCLWAGQMRPSEPLPNSSDMRRFNTTSHPTVSSLSVSKIDGTRRLKLPKSRGEVVIPGSSTKAVNANDALVDHIFFNRLEPQHPLFSYRDPNDALQVMTRVRFMEVCHMVWGEQGVPHISAHSFRVGGATNYLRSGVPASTVKVMGRWNSDVLQYCAKIHRDQRPRARL